MFFNVGRLGLILITRRRARALAERASSQENLGLSPSSNEWPAPPPPVPQSRESLFHSFLRSVRSNRAEAQDQALSAIPTHSEGSSISWCSSNQSVNSQEEVILEDVVPSEINASGDNISVDSIGRNSDSSSDSEFSALGSGDLSLAPAYAEMENQVNQLCQAVEGMQASINSQSRNVSVKSSVTFPVFRGDECEDVHEFIRNYKRAGRLNGWDDVNLSLGLPLYLKGHASAWFNTLPTPDEMSFDELSEELVTHFGSGASEWRVRQALGQRRQLEKESVADYSYGLRTHCARINLPRTEWTHYFVQGLLPEIREYVVLQQPESLEVAENYAKLKESVLATSGKKEEFSPKEVSAQILEELSKAIGSKDKSPAVSAINQREPFVSKSEMKQIVRDEFRDLMGTASTRPNSFNQRYKQPFQSRGLRSRFGDAICYNCGKKGHTYYYCRSRPDPRVPRRVGNRQSYFQPKGQGGA